MNHLGIIDAAHSAIAGRERIAKLEEQIRALTAELQSSKEAQRQAERTFAKQLRQPAVVAFKGGNYLLQARRSSNGDMLLILPVTVVTL